MSSNEGRISKIIQNNFYLKIIAIAIGLFFWLFVQLSTPEKEREIANIKIDIDRELAQLNEIGITATEYENAYISVKVKGETLVVNSLDAGDFLATLDTTNISQSGETQVKIKVEAFDNTGRYELVTYSPQYIKVTFDRITQKTFTIETNINTVNVEEEFLLQDPKITPPEIVVNGPEKEIEKIEKVILDVASPPEEALSESYKANGEIKLYDGNDKEIKSKKITLSETSAILNIPVYKEKTIPIIINVVGAPERFPEKAFALTKESVRIAGPRGAIDKISEIIFNKPIDEIQPNVDYVFDVDEKIPDDLINIDNIQEIVAQLQIDNVELDTTTITISKENIRIINPPSDYDYTIVSDVVSNIQIIGDKDFINRMTKNDIIVEVDFFGKPSTQLSEGRHHLVANVKVVSNDLAWAFGEPAYVSLDLKSKS